MASSWRDSWGALPCLEVVIWWRLPRACSPGEQPVMITVQLHVESSHPTIVPLDECEVSVKIKLYVSRAPT